MDFLWLNNYQCFQNWLQNSLLRDIRVVKLSWLTGYGSNYRVWKFDSVLDAFGGTGAVSYRFKQENKAVTYNDILRFNSWFGLALIENPSITLDADDIAIDFGW